MSVKQFEGSWLVDVRPQGRKGPRVRKKFSTKSEAQQYERWIIATQNNKEWLAQTRSDPRTLSDLIALWWTHHGQGLTSGQIIRDELDRICEELGNPKADTLNKKQFSEYRARRMEAGIKPATINREQAMLSGVYTNLIKAGVYTKSNPLSLLTRIKNPQKEMAFLSHQQIGQLQASLSGDHLKLARFCLSTGARWNEAASLRPSAVIKYKVTFNKTKNGTNRTVPISKELYEEIMSGDQQKKVFPEVNYRFFRSLVKSLFELPSNQATHVLRHTFASHFIMNGGNILTLQKILGHASINQTMIYAHLAPDYLNDAISLNPLSGKTRPSSAQENDPHNDPIA